MASLTVRNIPDDAKLRFRKIAAAHGRSMEEHLRQLVIEAESADTADAANRVADVRQAFQHQSPEKKENWVHELIRLADGADADLADTRKYADIRFMTAKDAMAELRRLANGAGLDLPGRMNPKLEAPDF